MNSILFKLVLIKAEPERRAELYFNQFKIVIKRGVVA